MCCCIAFVSLLLLHRSAVERFDSAGGQPPCGGGAEPWSPTQIHIARCDDASTLGWGKEDLSQHALDPATAINNDNIDGKVTSAAAAAGVVSWPRHATDVNVMVSESGSVFGPWYQSGILSGNRS